MLKKIIQFFLMSCIIINARADMKPYVNGYFQFRWQAAFEEDAFTNTIKFRRAFIGLKGEIAKDVLYKITLNTARGWPDLADALLYIKFFPHFYIMLGQFKVPIGMDKLQSGSTTLFPERPLVSSFVIDRDMGFSMNFMTRVFSLQMGLFNGEGKNKIDMNENKIIASRMVISPFKFLHLGGAYLTGKTGAQIDTLLNLQKYGIELSLRTPSLLLSGEYMGGTENTVKSSSYYVELAYTIFLKKTYLYGIQPAVRYETEDSEIEEGGRSLITSGINIYFLPKHKLKLNICYLANIGEEDSNSDHIITQMQFKF